MGSSSTEYKKVYHDFHTRFAKYTPLAQNLSMPVNGKEEKWIAEVLRANEAARRAGGAGGSGGGAGGGGGSSSSRSPPLPRSVRNAPENLRTEIRRSQNREVSSYFYGIARAPY